MRFLADGPTLPDDLLTARDQGQVIFFCGAWGFQGQGEPARPISSVNRRGYEDV
jgi:hypothetical protein